MIRKNWWLLILCLVLLSSFVPGCTRTAEAADSYVAVVPSTLYAGESALLSISLFNGNKMVDSEVQVSLTQAGREVISTSVKIKGKDIVEFPVPANLKGDFTLELKGKGFSDSAPVTIKSGGLIFLETDKPIYKPGQTVRIRALTLTSELKSLTMSAVIEVLDAKGIKIFRKEVVTNDYGLTSIDLPLSSEPNLGVWKIAAVAGESKDQLDIRVEEYVLPKYEVKVDLPKEWYLAGEQISGKISGEYSFGKPVKGQYTITAQRYVGRWEKYAQLSGNIDGEANFQLPAVGYVAGTPAGGGKGNVTLEVSIQEPSTGYEEKVTKLLTIASSPLTIQVIPEGPVFKPGLPFKLLLVTETPDNRPVDAPVKVNVSYVNESYKTVSSVERTINTIKGKEILELTPPDGVIAMQVDASSGSSRATKAVLAGYSPSGNFIHLEQLSEGIPVVGGQVRFKVHSTSEAANFYYEVISRGGVVYTDYTRRNEITITATPAMSPEARLLVYQILPSNEVAADSLPFKVEAAYPQNLSAGFGSDQVSPGDEVVIDIQAEGQSMVGLAAVDRSVFILAEERLNLQQVFAELERLYMQPQVEIHSVYVPIVTQGTKEIFTNNGVTVLTNKYVPAGQKVKPPPTPTMTPAAVQWERADALAGKAPMPLPAATPTATATAGQAGPAGLAEVKRVRQFFPETWIWDLITTDSKGKAIYKAIAPDSITTWKLRAIAISKEKGLGVAEDDLKVFQPFFLSIDLPYSAIRGEEFPVRVAIYNYLDTAQDVVVEIQLADWFELRDTTTKTINIKGNDIGGASFTISPKLIGLQAVKITARSVRMADAVVKNIIIEPEGIQREQVQNITIDGNAVKELDTTIPPGIVQNSGRAYLTVTSSFLTQTIEGLENLLRMPMGCGEQNMILFAPDVYIARYLKQSGQLKPEIMAKAEMLMITGYQRELTYMRSDGSFSAFGQQDNIGSLWLTAFVLRSFAEAKDLIYIDENILSKAIQWISQSQNADGSFDVVGFVHHNEMMGGVSGKDALTAYVASALIEAGERNNSSRAIKYLEGRIDSIEDAYTLAITAYALELGNSPEKEAACKKLMAMAIEDENGIHWSTPIAKPVPMPGALRMPVMQPNQSVDIETTAYGMLALMVHGDNFNAGRAARWLTSKRNALGGYGSTQDTVVALKALTQFAGGARSDVNLTITVDTEGQKKQLSLNRENYDVLQIIELPLDSQVKVTSEGKGQAIMQLVKRYNVLSDMPAQDETIKISVDYNTDQVQVNDLVTVRVGVSYNPPIYMEAGMVVLDISVPTGFAPLTESIDKVVKGNPVFKRYDIAGRKVIFYLENLKPGDKVNFTFQVKALYPVRAEGVSSKVYSYYNPQISAEVLGKGISVRG